jgi:argininosuccinate lyase
MNNKLWAVAAPDNSDHALRVERFTAGSDRGFDLLLAEHDVTGSLAHARMLFETGLITGEEWKLIHSGLSSIMTDILEGSFTLEEGVEDVHSQVELLLTARVGEAGKKLHTGRSRNDQVLLDIKLFLRDRLKRITEDTAKLFDRLIALSEEHTAVLLPGYTHLQLAMPSSFGLWFGAYAESLTDDLELVDAAFRICNRNPLGSAAGYGSPFPLDRELTTRLLGFESMNYNVVYAQMTRGKTERAVAVALAAVGATLAKMSYDVCLYLGQNFDFISFPSSLTTGSSIMPHKKNPDVFELIRARCNRLQALPNELSLVLGNLPSGYHRDLQLTKEILFPAVASLQECLQMMEFMLRHITVRGDILSDERYAAAFSVEEVNREVMNGASFREAYRTVAGKIASGEFNPDRTLHHTLAGSMGNLCNKEISDRFKKITSHIL